MDPTSIAAEDGRIREGDQIIKVNTVMLSFKYWNAGIRTRPWTIPVPFLHDVGHFPLTRHDFKRHA